MAHIVVKTLVKSGSSKFKILISKSVISGNLSYGKRIEGRKFKGRIAFLCRVLRPNCILDFKADKKVGNYKFPTFLTFLSECPRQG